MGRIVSEEISAVPQLFTMFDDRPARVAFVRSLPVPSSGHRPCLDVHATSLMASRWREPLDVMRRREAIRTPGGWHLNGLRGGLAPSPPPHVDRTPLRWRHG